MAISLVANVLGTGGINGATTGSVDTTGANLIVVSTGYYYPGGSVSVSDNKGNAYVPLTQRHASANSGNRMFYCLGATVGSGHTFTVSGNGTYAALAVAAFSNVSQATYGGSLFPVGFPVPFYDPSGYDGYDGETGSATSSVSPGISTGSLTPSREESLMVTGLGFDINATYTVNSGFTITNQQPWVNGVNMGVGLAYKIKSSASSENVTWSPSGFHFGNLATSLVSFLQEPPEVSTGIYRRRLLVL